MKLRLIAVALVTVGWFEARSQTNTDKMEFYVASVKQNRSAGDSISNFPLGPGAVYVPNGGFFSATGFPLITYIAFAYKLMANDMQSLGAQLPAWAATDRFDIQARAQGNPDKDQMRLMMRSLLADRFRLAIHEETREVPVFALVLSKPATTGPKLQPHSGDAPCATEASAPSAAALGQTATLNQALATRLPVLCGGIFGMRPTAPGLQRAAARDVTMGLIANFLPGPGNLGRPVVDQTGLKGTYDFSLEWAPESRSGGESKLTSLAPPGAELQPDQSGPMFVEALKEQLGLRLESTKGGVKAFVVDHVERPSQN